jgi:hypothetical protein
MTCSICMSPITGQGHNAEPINSGRCCEDCNAFVLLVRHHASLGEPRTFKDFCYDMWERGMEFERAATVEWLNKQARLYPGAADLVKVLAEGIHAELPHRKDTC